MPAQLETRSPMGHSNQIQQCIQLKMISYSMLVNKDHHRCGYEGFIFQNKLHNIVFFSKIC